MTLQSHTKTNNRKPPYKAVFSCPEECAERINSYFCNHLPAHTDEVADVEALADYLSCTRNDIFEMMSDKKYSPAVTRAMNRIAFIKKQLAFKGKIPAAVFVFDMKNNHSYKDKPENCDNPERSTVILKGEAGKWGD